MARALCVHVRGQRARQGLYMARAWRVHMRCTHASTHVQWTISMRVRGRAVIFVTFNAFAHMLSKCVFLSLTAVFAMS